MPDDTESLRLCVKHLAALSTLAAGWSRSEPQEIADRLADLLHRALPVAFAYVRLRGRDGEGAVDAARPNGNPNQDAPALTVSPLGNDGDCGVVVTAWPQPAGPTDQLLLDAAVNQASAALQRRHVEEQLRRSESELADFFENAPVGLHWVGPDGTILRANRAELRLLGYSAEEYIGRHIAEFHADEDVIGDILRRLLAGEELHDCEARMRCKDGTLRHVAISSNSLRLHGRFIHTRCFTRDISDRKRVEEALRRQSNQFTTLVEHIPDIVARLDRDLRYLYMGPAVRAITGTPAHEYIGKPRTNAGLAPEFAAARERLSRKVFETGQEEILEFPIRTPAGERILECRFIPERAPDGSVETLMTLTRDVTERTRADERLRASEERFRMVADNISQLTWTCDQLGNVNWYNKRWLDYTGLSFEEMKGWGWTKVHHPDHLDRVVEGVTRSRESGEVWEDTFPLRGKDGTYRWFLSRAVPIRNGAGDVVHWFGTSTDITEERLLQESLRESDRRKDEFLATLAHELRNPLAPIRTGLEVLKMTNGDADATKAIRASMERQTQQLIALVDDLLDVSRITRGRLKLQVARVELADVVRSAVETSKPHIDAAGHELTVSLPDSPLYLDADPNRLSQVLANLLNNAAKYTPKRGRIRLAAGRAGGEVVVTVEDSGVGIPAEMYERVFEMFTQIDRPLEKGHTGLGIGLTLVKSLVEMHGGTIGVHSDGENRGSTFTVRLPIPAATTAGDTAPGSAGEESVLRGARRVLVVDDNEEAADMLAMLLSMLGNDVRTAGDGQEALEVAAGFQPEVVLMDLGMPRMDGYEAATRMRATAWGKRAVLIALTGWGQDEDKQRTEAAGFDHHLVKPANPSAIQAILADPSAVARR